ncbi:hypothetical protein AJ79_06385 [Helicocarpus griseus UAMH5409]|uniref:Uncharacterized protein n=1 Tax=Helicocarpus griseus UAMH5409 TaxID=1447875 RepID=A0A2B7XD88_9EURO|nr:hypothetical protein AJ79_06385 [Helicocarpus griseus UAMH5409]
MTGAEVATPSNTDIDLHGHPGRTTMQPEVTKATKNNGHPAIEGPQPPVAMSTSKANPTSKTTNRKILTLVSRQSNQPTPSHTNTSITNANPLLISTDPGYSSAGEPYKQTGPEEDLILWQRLTWKLQWP